MYYYTVCDNCGRTECVCGEQPEHCSNCETAIYTCSECGILPRQCHNCNKQLINVVFIVKNLNNNIYKVFSDKEQAYSYANRENLELLLKYNNRDRLLCEKLDIIDNYLEYYNFIWNNLDKLINLSDDYHSMIEIVEMEIDYEI